MWTLSKTDGRPVFRSALVPVDAGFIPRRALRTAAAAAVGGDVEITLLHVIDVGRDVVGSGYYSVVTDDDVPLFASHICQTLGDARAIISECGATAAALVVLGGPLHMVIKEVARALWADVIIMGTHGRRGLSRVLRGSVTETVIREAEIPVLVVNESLGRPSERFSAAWLETPPPGNV
jgi:nucleotide-binding universal stress UspA family protein